MRLRRRRDRHPWMAIAAIGMGGSMTAGLVLVGAANAAAQESEPTPEASAPASASSAPSPPSPASPPSDARLLPVDRATLAVSALGLTGHGIAGAIATITLFNAAGDLTWQQSYRASDDGTLVVPGPEILGLPGSYTGTLTVHAHGFIPEQQQIRVSRSPDGLVSIVPSTIALRLASTNPWLTLWLLFPAAIGSIVALRFLATAGRTLTKYHCYPLWAASSWLLATVAFVILYLRNGDHLIPLFWSDTHLSSGVIVAAFIGGFTYAAWSVVSKVPEFFDSATEPRVRRLAMAKLGGRLYVGPYVAFVGYGVLALTFPAMESGAFALFFGFFTGMYVKVVVDRLNQLGVQMLSDETRKKVLSRMRGELDAGVLTRQIVRGGRPRQAYLDAVEQARAALLEREGVVGVGPGYTTEGSPAVVAYVVKKRALPPGDPNRLPASFGGHATVVRELDPPSGRGECDRTMLYVDAVALDREHDRLRTSGAAPASHVVERVDNTDVVMVVDPANELFVQDATSDPRFAPLNVVKAYKRSRQVLADSYDFIAFVVHNESNAPYWNSYYEFVHNDVQGINFAPARRRGMSSLRSEFRTTRLVGCQVYESLDLSLRLLLHELGHAWCAYVTVDHAEILNGPHHWSQYLAAQHTCMYSSRRHWVSCDGTDRLRPREASIGLNLDTDNFAYSELDLYLMGLLDPAEIRKPLAVMERVDGGCARTIASVTVEDIIEANDPRVPDHETSTKTFRQAFVLVTRNPDEGERYARDVMAGETGVLRTHEENFRRATHRRGTITTRLDP
jgi:hypothetical protein